MFSYNLAGPSEVFETNPELLGIIRKAGITDFWFCGFLYGHWYYPLERTNHWLRVVKNAGLAGHMITVPLGHPGDSLGDATGGVPLTPPKHWKYATMADGSRLCGTSIHEPATIENINALKEIAKIGVDKVFLDDDFRLAHSPGVIGGCFCEEHKQRFLSLHGYSDVQWQELLDVIASRRLTTILRQWVDFTCDDLSGSFFAQQSAVPGVHLGSMWMHMGAEKAGIRLTDYGDAFVRVGEGSFDDDSFGKVKGKTNELFSVLFHRRFIAPELSYSETTAYPADMLSAANMAAKLNITLLADVRNTMFMSGVTAFPLSHWDTLAPAMKKRNAIAEVIAGHKPVGPFKHYWGDAGRYVSDDNTYSLFLASGVPFEVIDRPCEDGWMFLADADAQSVTDGMLTSPGTTFITRSNIIESGRAVPETLDDLFAFKNGISASLQQIPYVLEDVPIVCAWYADINCVLLWNLAEKSEDVTVKYMNQHISVHLSALDAELVRL